MIATLLVAVISLGLLWPVQLASAAEPTISRGVTLSPTIRSLNLQPGQTKTSFTQVISNDTDQKVVVIPRAADFTATGVGGAIDFNASNDLQHGLARYVQFSIGQFALQPKQSQTVTVSIAGDVDINRGGHYTALRYAVHPADGSAASVGLQSELLGFLFVATPGSATTGMQLKTALPRVAWWELPSEAQLLFTNTGNTQTAPHGTVTIAGPVAGVVKQGTVNIDSALVLPGATRLIQTDLKSRNLALMPGRYKTTVAYRAADGQQLVQSEQQMLYIGWPFISATAIVIVGLLVLGRLFLKRWRKPKADSKPVTKTRKIPIKHL